MTVGVTDAFRAAYAGSHRSTVTGSLYSPDGQVLPVTFDRVGNNSVQVDVTAANRRSCALTLVDDGTLRPVSATSPTSPINEIALWRGIRFIDDTVELCPLGIFGIQEAFETATPAGPAITVNGSDRSKRLDVILTHGLSFAAATSFAFVLAALADASGVTFSKFFDPIVFSTLTPVLVFHAGDNIWEQIQTAASSLGCWAYFDEVGTFTVVPVPDPDGQPIDWVYAHGAGATFDDTARRLALEDGSQRAYSHAIVESTVQATGAFIRADAFDTDPSSPTYVSGPFGDRAIKDDSVGAFITTQAQGDASAAALLRRNYGLLERATMRTLPNPALTGGDILQVTDPNTDTDGVYITESFPIPLFAAGGSQPITCRSRQLH